MSFSSPGWIFLPFAVAGLILALRLTAAMAGRVGRPLRVALFLLLAGTWIALLWQWTRPHRTRTETIFHPPVVVWAVDRSASFAGGTAPWLGVGSETQKPFAAWRAHYSGLGFKVLEIEFAERAAWVGKSETPGTLTRLSALPDFLDSAGLSNLQGIFLWSDGRFNGDPEGGAPDWPAPLFPVLATRGGSDEVQGEILTLDFSRPDSGLTAVLEWICLRSGSCAAQLDLSSDGVKIWGGTIKAEMGTRGERLHSRIPIPRGLRANATARWSALLKPDPPGVNLSLSNDTVPVKIRGGRKWRNLFPRPLRSLEERGLMDALRNSDSLEALAVVPESLETGTRSGDVIWLPRQTGGRWKKIAAQAKARGVAVIQYTFEDNRATDGFSPEARLSWSREGEPFLPAGVVRLADLGGKGWRLAGMDSGDVRLVWADEKGRMGRLVNGGNKDSGIWDAVLPPLWSSVFQSEVDARVRRNQEEWVQGLANWARSGSGSAAKANTEKFVDRPPLAVELGVLGTDVQGLGAWANGTRGHLIRMEDAGDGSGDRDWPEFSTGQIAEEKSHSRALVSPGVLALVAALLLTALWALRKMSRLD